ncbi:MAG: serine hydrolase domain-containing protein, partial [Polaribacter sp.]|uniref:serine hydrolase domain-containing protein n=1 Tax=Polaribacter sp. TaxID=1920175 RepID=UPI003218EF28
MKISISFVFLFFSTIASTQNAQISKIDSIVNSKIKSTAPGLMVGIVKDGNIIYQKYRGLANLEHQVKISEKTRSNIASTAKQFTALMILQLSFEEKLDLEDDIRKYLPTFYPKVKENIKIRHLLNHTSGIRDYVELMSLQKRIWWKQVGLDNDDVLELIEKQEDLGFKPGSRFSYSNSNYNILARIIAKVTEEKFTTYSDTFFKELGMNSTSFLKGYMRVIPNKAAPYADWGYGELFHSISVTRTAGEGFLYTTLKDQLTFEQAVQNADRNNNILLIKSQLPIPNSEIKSYGFGLKLEDRLGRKTVYHDGVTNAYHAQSLRFPKEKLSVFIMSNNGNIRSDLLADEIATVLLPRLDQKPKYDTRFYESKIDKKAQIVGQYLYPNEDKLVRIVQKDGKTFWKEGTYYNLEMIAEGENTFKFANNPKLKIVFYNDKLVEYYASGKTMEYKRSKALPAKFTDFESFVGNYYNQEIDLSFGLRLTNENKLEFMFSNDEKWKPVEVYNKVDLFTDDNKFLKVKRDQFNRVTDIFLTHGRVKKLRFRKKSNLKFQPKIKTKNGSINVTTIGSRKSNSSQILLTKNYENGNEIWSQQFGGKSYDKASS